MAHPFLVNDEILQTMPLNFGVVNQPQPPKTLILVPIPNQLPRPLLLVNQNTSNFPLAPGYYTVQPQLTNENILRLLPQNPLPLIYTPVQNTVPLTSSIIRGNETPNPLNNQRPSSKVEMKKPTPKLSSAVSKRYVSPRNQKLDYRKMTPIHRALHDHTYPCRPPPTPSPPPQIPMIKVPSHTNVALDTKNKLRPILPNSKPETSTKRRFIIQKCVPITNTLTASNGDASERYRIETIGEKTMDPKIMPNYNKRKDYFTDEEVVIMVENERKKIKESKETRFDAEKKYKEIISNVSPNDDLSKLSFSTFNGKSDKKGENKKVRKKPSLIVPCHYQKHGCRVLLDQYQIIQHEEVCEFKIDDDLAFFAEDIDDAGPGSP